MQAHAADTGEAAEPSGTGVPPGDAAVPLARAAALLGGDPATWKAAARLFPVRWPARYLAIAAGPGGEAIRRMGSPDQDELTPSPDELRDPVGEAALHAVPFVVSKHADRAILLVTAACHFYCRFCFRRSFPEGGHRGPSPGEIARALDHLRALPDLREVILSGGDPLTLPDARLREILAACAAIPQVERLRVHSRAPVHAPGRVTDALAAILGATGKPLRLVTHANHAAEVDAACAEAVGRLRRQGIAVLNQSVLLRGVNDDPAVLAALLARLDDIGVEPYYLHHPDRVPGAARFFVSVPRGLAIVSELRRLRAGARMPTHVIDPPDGSGKVPVEDITQLAGGRLRAPSGFEWADVTEDEAVAISE